MKTKIDTRKDAAVEAVKAAGEIAERRFGKPLDVKKDDGSFVSCDRSRYTGIKQYIQYVNIIRRRVHTGLNWP